MKRALREIGNSTVGAGVGGSRYLPGQSINFHDVRCVLAGADDDSTTVGNPYLARVTVTGAR